MSEENAAQSVAKKLGVFETHYRTVATTVIVVLVGWAIALVHDLPAEVRLLRLKMEYFIEQSQVGDAELRREIAQIRERVNKIEDRERDRYGKNGI